MANFVYDNAALPSNKLDLRPLRTGRAPGNAGRAVDFNALWSALGDARSALLAATLIGWTPQASRPVITGAPSTTPLLWPKTDGHIYWFDGTADHDLLAGGGGGGYATIYDGASPATARTILKVDGVSLTATDGTGGDSTKTLLNFTGVLNVAGVGVGQVDGYVAANPDAATAGNPKNSPMVRQTGHAWNTNSGGASHAVDFATQTVPSSAAGDLGSWILWCRLNGGSWADVLDVDQAGNLTSGGAVFSYGSVTAFYVSGVGTAKVDGLVALTGGAAAVGAQQYSPLIRWTGYGWATGSGGSSQEVDFAAHLRPVQGTTNPTGELWFAAQVNGGGWVDVFRLLSTGGAKVLVNAIGVGNVTGFELSNSTVAGAGAQQLAPMLVFTGQGWKTNSTAASQAVQLAEQLTPVQGTAAPTGLFSWSFAINGGGWSAAAFLDSLGNFTAEGAGAFTGLSTAVASGSAFVINYAQSSAGAYTLINLERNGTTKGSLALDSSDYFNLQGSVGINIKSPTASTLAVVDSSGFTIRDAASANYMQITASMARLLGGGTGYVTIQSSGFSYTQGSDKFYIDANGPRCNATRMQESQGANVASANNLALGTDGNFFVVTGTTQVNLISSTSWQAGSRIALQFAGALTIKNNQTASGANKPVRLAGSADLTTTANEIVRFRYDGTQWWQESPAVTF